MTTAKPYFFCGIGGSGMLPLAAIVRAQGATVAGSDRSLDQGRTADKFDWLQQQGISLFPQDGSGLTSADQVIVASAAVEDSVPDIAKARELGCVRMTRADLLAELLNAADSSIAVGGTSGKSTVTGMIGWILSATGHDPTIMNGAVMKNFISPDSPFASSRVGREGPFVAEVDESDGSIALYRPGIAVLNNISEDHKSMDELRRLFGDFLSVADHAIWNADDPECAALAERLDLTGAASFGFASHADVRASAMTLEPTGGRFVLHAGGDSHAVRLRVPGRHNIANALAAVAACAALEVPVGQAVAALADYAGLARRFDIVGEAGGVTVIDDFGHNPDKIAATLAALKAFPGRVIAFFQPHGFGPLKKMGAEIAAAFTDHLDSDDCVILCDPVYFGGTVDRSVGSERVVQAILGVGGSAEYIALREDCGKRLAELAQPGDRIVIMGARDDTLSVFAKSLLEKLGS